MNIGNTIFSRKCSVISVHLPLTNASKHDKITGKGDEGECPGKDPVEEKWRLVRAMNAEAGGACIS